MLGAIIGDKEKAYSYLDEPLKDVIERWELYIAGK
jgi:ADP-ribosylglycohydrolase family protein